MVATILVGYLICTPLSYNWDQSGAGHCGNTSAAYISLGVVDIITDIAIFALPMPMLYKLQVPRHTKIALVATFALGILTIAAGCMRLVAVVQIDFGLNFEEGQTGDVYWCAIEASVGIIVGCCIVMKPILERALPAFSRLTSWTKSLSRSRTTNFSSETTSTNPTKAQDDRVFLKLDDGEEPLRDLSPGSRKSGKSVGNDSSFGDVV